MDEKRKIETENLLLKCQVKLGVKTEYALAKGLGIPTQRIYDYISGKRAPNNYALVKIADCLNLNPMELITEFEILNAKNEAEKTFWQKKLEECQEPQEKVYNRIILKSMGVENK